MVHDFYEPTDEEKRYINDKDIQALRGIIVGIINRDPTFATKRYDEAIDYICNRIDIWSESSEKLPGEYEVEQEEWDKDYFRKKLAWLSQNFVRERVEEIKKIGKKVYANDNTWGKQEAENFYHPVAQKRRKRESQSGIGGLMAAILVVMIVLTEVVVLTTEFIFTVKMIVLVVGVIIILGIIMNSTKKLKKEKEN